MPQEQTGKNQIIEGVIWKQLLIFFFPIMVGTLFQQLYNTVDAVIVGRFVGKAALASVGGSASVILNLFLGFFTGLSSGATVIISQFYGAKDQKNLHTSLHTAYALSIAMSLAVSVIGYFITPWVIEITKTPADVAPDSLVYLRIYFVGIIAVQIYNMGSAIMRSIGDSKRPLYYLIVSCVINIILDLVFVVIFRIGVAGVAIATLIAQAVSAFLVTRSLMHAYDDIKLFPKQIAFDMRKLKAEFQIGLPSAIQSCVYSISNIIIQTAVNSLGTDTVAAWAAYGKLDAIFWAINGAFGIAITTFAGQNFGAGKKERVFKSVRTCLFMSMTVGIVLVSFLMIFCRPLYGFFTDDEKVIEIGVYMLIKIMPSYLFFIFIEIYSGALRGMGDVLVPTLITLGGVGLVRLPWILILTPIYNHIDIPLYSYPISWGVTAALIIPYYHYRKRKILSVNK